MAKTLKQRYENKKVQNLQERIRHVDNQLLREERTANLIIEAMDEEDLKKVSQVIDKLRTLKGKGLPSLDTAIEQAEAELNKYTGGGAIAKAWGKLKSKVGIDNPVVKIMTMADALEQGFKQMPVILKNNLGDMEQLKTQSDKTIDDLVTDAGKKKTLVANIVKALSPKGVFGSFKKLPYLDRDVLASDITATKLSSLAPLIKAGTSGVSPQEVASDLKGIASKGGETQTKSTVGGEPGQEPSKAAGGSPGKPSTGSSKGQAAPQQGSDSAAIAKKVYDDIRSDFEGSGSDEKTVLSILKTLADNDKLK